MNFFKHLSKGSDLHTHFSSLIDQKQIFDDIKDLKLDKNLFYNLFKNELYFDFDNNQDINFHKHEEDIIKLIQNSIFVKTNKIENYTQKSFVHYKLLGNLLYCIIKNEKYYKNYIKLIYKHMKKNNYYILETRLKLDFDPDQNIVSAVDMLNYIEQKNDRYQIKIIMQFSRGSKNLLDEVLKALRFVSANEKIQKLIVGVDFTGYEVNEINRDVMENDEVIELMDKMNIQFYNHGGEFIAENVDNFDFESNINFRNCRYLLEHQEKYKKIYKRPIRIGHGLIYLQYLYKNNLKQDNIVFEICPFSNEHFYGGQLDKEIYQQFQDQIVICTDDENKIGRNLADCYNFLSEFLDFDSIKKLILNGIKFSSLSQDDKIYYTKKVNQKLEKVDWNQKKSHVEKKIWWKIDQFQFDKQRQLFNQYKYDQEFQQRKKVKYY